MGIEAIVLTITHGVQAKRTSPISRATSWRHHYVKILGLLYIRVEKPHSMRVAKNEKTTDGYFALENFSPRDIINRI